MAEESVMNTTAEELSAKVLKYAQRGDVPMIESLLAGLAPKEVKELLASTDVDGYSPMHRAAYNGRHAMLRYLILHGAANCVHARTSEGWTPLHSAARWGQVEIARLLLANGADINAATEGRQTPLHLAAAQAKPEVIKLLLTHRDIDATLENNQGETARQVAERAGPHTALFALQHPSLGCDAIRVRPIGQAGVSEL